jgi:hypothetical protein
MGFDPFFLSARRSRRLLLSCFSLLLVLVTGMYAVMSPSMRCRLLLYEDKIREEAEPFTLFYFRHRLILSNKSYTYWLRSNRPIAPLSCY